MPFFPYAIFALLIVLSPALPCCAGDTRHSICDMVSTDELAGLCTARLYPSTQENGCRWSDRPNGKAYFQIGLIQSPKALRKFFEKKIPGNYQLKKITDLGDRGLFTESRGYFSVIAIREGSWVLISTVDLLYIKEGDTRQDLLWDIYREILQSLE